MYFNERMICEMQTVMSWDVTVLQTEMRKGHLFYMMMHRLVLSFPLFHLNFSCRGSQISNNCYFFLSPLDVMTSNQWNWVRNYFISLLLGAILLLNYSQLLQIFHLYIYFHITVVKFILYVLQLFFFIHKTLNQKIENTEDTNTQPRL